MKNISPITDFMHSLGACTFNRDNITVNFLPSVCVWCSADGTLQWTYQMATTRDNGINLECKRRKHERSNVRIYVSQRLYFKINKVDIAAHPATIYIYIYEMKPEEQRSNQQLTCFKWWERQLNLGFQNRWRSRLRWYLFKADSNIRHEASCLGP